MKFSLFLDNGEQININTEDYTDPTRTVMEYLISMLEYYEAELSFCDEENELLYQQVEYGKLLTDLLKTEIKN
jgi:hypothetical protein